MILFLRWIVTRLASTRIRSIHGWPDSPRAHPVTWGPMKLGRSPKGFGREERARSPDNASSRAMPQEEKAGRQTTRCSRPTFGYRLVSETTRRSPNDSFSLARLRDAIPYPLRTSTPGARGKPGSVGELVKAASSPVRERATPNPAYEVHRKRQCERRRLRRALPARQTLVSPGKHGKIKQNQRCANSHITIMLSM
jgi:hypothetical protein